MIELLDIKIKDTIQGPADKLIQPKQVEIKQQKPQRTGYQRAVQSLDKPKLTKIAMLRI